MGEEGNLTFFETQTAGVFSKRVSAEPLDRWSTAVATEVEEEEEEEEEEEDDDDEFTT